MKRLVFSFTAVLLSITALAQTAGLVIQQVLQRQQQVHQIAYTLQRTDTIGTNIRTMQGTVIMERDPADTLLGFRFWAQKENDAVEKMYNGRAGYAIDNSTGQYEMAFSAGAVLNLFNGGGGHLVMRDLLTLDTSRVISRTLDSDDTAYYLLFRYANLDRYDVFNRYKQVTVNKRTMLPVAVREHQESYGRIQDLYFKILTCTENEAALTYNFFTPAFLQNYTLYMPVRKPGAVHGWVGKPVPPLSLPGFDGQTVNTAHWKGKVVLLDFWEVWCGPCLQSMPAVQALHDHYRQQGLLVYGVVNDTANFGASRLMITRQKMSFPVLKGGMAVQQLFNINGVPLYMVIDKEGIIRYVSEGFSEKIEKVIKENL